MQVIAVPLRGEAYTKEQWSVQKLQFTPHGRALVVDLNHAGRSKRQLVTSRFIGRVDVPSGKWTLEEQQDYGNFDAPLTGGCPCRRDFGCVISGAWLEADGIVINVSHPDYNDPNAPQVASRSVQSSSGIAWVRGLLFAPDNRWLFGVEEWNVEGTPHAGLARGEVQALFEKAVIYEPATNRLTGTPYTRGYVKPIRWKRFATLPAGVRAEVLALSADVRLVAAGAANGDVHLIRVRDGTSLSVLPRQSRKRVADIGIRRMAFTSTGKILGVLSEWSLKVWAVNQAQLLWRITARTSGVTDFDFQPNGSLVAVADLDGTMSFFDAQSGKLQKRYDWKVGQLNSVAFSPDGLTCAAGGEKGQVVVWDVDS